MSLSQSCDPPGKLIYNHAYSDFFLSPNKFPILESFSNLMVLRFFMDPETNLVFNLRSKPVRRSPPDLRSGSKGISVNNTLLSIPERLPPKSDNACCSIVISLLGRIIVSIAAAFHDKDPLKSDGYLYHKTNWKTSSQ